MQYNITTKRSHKPQHVIDYVNNAGFDDAEKNSLDNDCHHQKAGDYECMNT